MALSRRSGGRSRLTIALLVFTLLVENYLSGRFFNRLSTGLAITVVLACAQTIVILKRLSGANEMLPR